MNEFTHYKPNIVINVSTSNYILKTANCVEELEELFKMRHTVFFGNDNIIEKLDYDDFDKVCDHIIIVDKSTSKAVGTYRILCSLFIKDFYSENEFFLDEFLKVEGIKMELGRASIIKEHRNGPVMDLLWKGLAEYIIKSDAKFMFGCSSIMTTDLTEANRYFEYFKKREWIKNEYDIKPIGKYYTDLKNYPVGDYDENIIKSNIPPLLRSYITAGAFIYGQPALDIDFGCIDFFTIIDLTKLNSLHRKRYFKNANKN